jgi:hypothetical protein
MTPFQGDYASLTRQSWRVSALLAAALVCSLAVVNSARFSPISLHLLTSLNLGGEDHQPADDSAKQAPDTGNSSSSGSGNGSGGGAAAAGGAAALGGAAAIKVAESGCSRGATELIESSERSGSKALVRGAETARLGESARFGETLAAKEGRFAFGGALGGSGDILEKQASLRAVREAIEHTPAGSKLHGLELDTDWDTNPKFRAQAISELAEHDPEALANLKVHSDLFNTLDPLIHENDAIAVVVKDEHIVWSGGTAKVSKSQPVAYGPAKQELQEKLQVIVKQVLDEMPSSAQQPSDVELKNAISKALEPQPKGSYSFNVASGKLTLKIQTPRGQIEGEVNAYRIIRKTIYLVGVGAGVTNRDDIVQLAKKYFHSRRDTSAGSN